MLTEWNFSNETKSEFLSRDGLKENKLHKMLLVGKVTRSDRVKNNPRLHAILQPHHPGIRILKIFEWLLST